MAQPTYIVFAGVNGVGKSTFYHSGQWAASTSMLSMPRVNPDEILVRSGGKSDSRTDQMRAGREALRMMDDLFAKRKSFNQETTLTGHLSLRSMERARSLGYRIILYYIGVDSPETSLARIAHRVSVGGHPIDEESVRRRYIASIRNLSRALDMCDEATVFDNSIEFVTIAQWTHGVISWVGDIAKRGPWLLEAMKDEAVWRA